MVSYRKFKNLFKNYKEGSYLLIKEQEEIGYLFERKGGDVYYLGKYIKNKIRKKEILRDFCGIEISVKDSKNKYILYPGQKLPAEVSPIFFKLFSISPFEKSKLEEKIKEINIKS